MDLNIPKSLSYSKLFTQQFNNLNAIKNLNKINNNNFKTIQKKKEKIENYKNDNSPKPFYKLKNSNSQFYEKIPNIQVKKIQKNSSFSNEYINSRNNKTISIKLPELTKKEYFNKYDIKKNLESNSMSNMLKLIKPLCNIRNTSFDQKENKKLFMKKINLTKESSNNNNISYSENNNENNNNNNNNNNNKNLYQKCKNMRKNLLIKKMNFENKNLNKFKTLINIDDNTNNIFNNILKSSNNITNTNQNKNLKYVPKNVLNSKKFLLKTERENKNQITIPFNHKKIFTERMERKKIQKLIIKNFSFTSQPGKLKTGDIKINQDSFLIINNVNGIQNFNIFGVLDGHGVNGHLISQFVTKYIKTQIEIYMELINFKNLNDIYYKLIENNYQFIYELYNNAEKELYTCDFDCSLSGTTCVLIFQIGKKIVCSNAGDSRAILCYQNMISKNLDFFELSHDFKPYLINEKMRIMKMGGVIEKFSENGVYLGPYRVWVKGEGYPGLAMSRSIGDLIASKIGVIPDPEIIEYSILENSRFIVLASDGIWDKINNNKICEIGKIYNINKDSDGFCNELIKIAKEKWEENDNCCDDITCIVLFF